MGRTLEQIQEIANGLPILFAGDMFHLWQSCPELTNFLIKNLLGNWFAVAGNHDLPLHNYKDVEKSSFHTLVQAQALKELPPNEPYQIGKYLIVQGFPCGYEPFPWTDEEENFIDRTKLAVIHEYVWKDGYGFHNAPDKQKVKSLLPNIQGYSKAIFGDNHHGFETKHIYNCGGLLRRNIDERELTPAIGKIYKSGRIERVALDVSGDRFLNVDNLSSEEYGTLCDMSELMDDLQGAVGATLDFAQTLREFCIRNKTAKAVRKLILTALEG